MTTIVDLGLLGAIAAVWLAAGLLAETLPEARTARALHRRTRVLLTLVVGGGGLLVAVPVVAMVGPAEKAAMAALLPGVPALLAFSTTLRRLNWLRRGAAAFAAAPATPASPALRAAAAHPLLATPLQVTGLAALAGAPIAWRAVQLPGAGMAITTVVLAVVAIGVRHAVRHSRLAERAVRIRAVVRSV
jgi:hypothetical protein